MAIFEWLKAKVSSAPAAAVPIHKLAVAEAMKNVLAEAKKHLSADEWRELVEAFRIICNSKFAPSEVSLILARVKPRVRKECDRFLAMVAHGKTH